MSSQEIWSAALPEETTFWKTWFETKGLHWKDDYLLRLDPDYQFLHELRPYVNAPRDATARILDVGAGPISVLGQVWPGRKLEVTAVDPLADQYNKIISENDVTPRVRTQTGYGEHLLDLFPASSFDFVYAQNCLDHSYDPLLCFDQMLAVVKPECFVVTNHLINEGENENYAGLHQWNFDVRGLFKPKFIIWQPGKQPIDLQKHLGSSAKVEAKRTSKLHVCTFIQKL
jgi:SAM-dependent methyltransferase